jgi:hypothetical protein
MWLTCFPSSSVSFEGSGFFFCVSAFFNFCFLTFSISATSFIRHGCRESAKRFASLWGWVAIREYCWVSWLLSICYSAEKLEIIDISNLRRFKKMNCVYYPSYYDSVHGNDWMTTCKWLQFFFVHFYIPSPSISHLWFWPNFHFLSTKSRALALVLIMEHDKWN